MTDFRVGRIDFINTAPVYLGIETGRVTCPGRTVLGPPARLNRLLAEGEIQVSAVSSAAYAWNFPNWLLLPELSISARGAVRSVVLRFAREPARGRPYRAALTHKSGTAQALVRILLAERYGAIPECHEVNLDRGVPQGFDGILVIGDDALRLASLEERYPGTLDLGEAWLDWTGLPFVFGVWAVDRAFAEQHRSEAVAVASALHRSKEEGKENLEAAALRAAVRSGVNHGVCREYLEHIEYDLGPEHRAGLTLFYEKLSARGESPPGVALRFLDLDAAEGARLV